MHVSSDGDTFIAQCDYWENARIKSAPKRKWDPTEKIWLLEANRANATWLSKELGEDEMDSHAQLLVQTLTLDTVKSAEPFPFGFQYKTTPMDHQSVALDAAYMCSEFALFMEMGTGKTWVAIQLMSQYWLEDKINMAIVICPTGVKPV